MPKKIIKLTENELEKIISETVINLIEKNNSLNDCLFEGVHYDQPPLPEGMGFPCRV